MIMADYIYDLIKSRIDKGEMNYGKRSKNTGYRIVV